MKIYLHSGFLICLMTVLLCVSACRKALDPKPEPPNNGPYTPPNSSFGLIYTEIFSASCSIGGCHDGDSRSPTLVGQFTYENIVSKEPINAAARDANLELIKPGVADSSFLYQKMIFDSSDFQFGSGMPLIGPDIDANKIEFLRQWIAAGAPLEGHVADRSLIE